MLVAVVAPAIAAGGIGLAIMGRPGPLASAKIANRSAGVFASFSAHPGRSFSVPGTARTAGFTRDLEWTLAVTAPKGNRVSARLAYASRRARLCDPCGADARGRTHPRAAWLNILDGRARLLLEVDGRTYSAPLRVRKR